MGKEGGRGDGWREREMLNAILRSRHSRLSILHYCEALESENAFSQRAVSDSRDFAPENPYSSHIPFPDRHTVLPIPIHLNLHLKGYSQQIYIQNITPQTHQENQIYFNQFYFLPPPHHIICNPH